MALIKMTLRDGAARVLSENFYWHAPRPEGYRGLNDLPAAEVACSAALVDEGGAARVNVELENRGPGVALAVQATVRDAASGARVLPAYATDNFVSLLPGERRRLVVEVPANSRGRKVRVSLKGWNVRDVSVAVRPG